MSGVVTTRILVLDDGETWEVVNDTSNALIVEVSESELQELVEGSPIDAVIPGRMGRRVAALLDDLTTD